jgi:pimeloyl-ACP methyl ester carboxylesterase
MTRIAFTARGEGFPLVLLHGFPFNKKIWNNFAERLSAWFKVYTPDLPGLGESPLLERSFTIEEVGDALSAWMESEKIIKPIVVGHSLGGYVALRLAETLNDRLTALVLFHSTAYADSEERKQSRNKVLEFIDKNGVQAFTSNFIIPLLADPQHPAVQVVRSIAMEASHDAVKGYTEAMRDRKDRTFVLRRFPHPVLFITGEKDQGISVSSIHEQASVCSSQETHVLSAVAHLGMFEKEDESLEILRSFILKNSVT